jgi:hypothetical protein
VGICIIIKHNNTFAKPARQREAVRAGKMNGNHIKLNNRKPWGGGADQTKPLTIAYFDAQSASENRPGCFLLSGQLSFSERA